MQHFEPAVGHLLNRLYPWWLPLVRSLVQTLSIQQEAKRVPKSGYPGSKCLGPVLVLPLSLWMTLPAAIAVWRRMSAHPTTHPTGLYLVSIKNFVTTIKIPVLICGYNPHSIEVACHRLSLARKLSHGWIVLHNCIKGCSWQTFN